MSEVDTFTRFGHLLAEKWKAEAEAAGTKAKAFDTTFRNSDAGSCSFALALHAAGIPQSNPPDLPAHWVMTLGTKVHEMVQEVLEQRYPGAGIETKVRTDDLTSGHIDFVVTEADGTVVAGEVKTMGGAAHKRAIGISTYGQAKRVTPEGPKTAHLIQGALNAHAVGADELVIVYLALEAVSLGVAARLGFSELDRFCNSWTFPRGEYLPWALTEIDRMASIKRMVESGLLPGRAVPQDPDQTFVAAIADPTNPPKETRWLCVDRYCRYADTCIALHAAGIRTVEEAKALRGAPA